MRVVMFSGKGGVGTTTAAAGTATVGALRGLRTLVVSLGVGSALSDAFDSEVGGEPAEVDDRLWAQQVDAWAVRAGCEGALTGVPVGLGSASSAGFTAADDHGSDRAASSEEELAALRELGPGVPHAELVAIWLLVRAHLRSGGWDVLALDAGPATTLARLAGTPTAVRSWLRRSASDHGAVGLRRLSPSAALVDEALAEVQTMLAAPETTTRLVLTPETVPLAEARRTFAGLGQQGLHVDGILVNRVFPWAGSDGWRRQWVAAQAAVVADTERAFAPIPVFCAAYRAGEPVGVEELAAFAAEAYGASDPFDPGVSEVPAAR